MKRKVLLTVLTCMALAMATAIGTEAKKKMTAATKKTNNPVVCVNNKKVLSQKGIKQIDPQKHVVHMDVKNDTVFATFNETGMKILSKSRKNYK